MSVPELGPRFHGEPPRYLTSPLLTRAGLPHLFTTRHFPGIRPWRDPAGPFEERALELLASRGLGDEAVAFLRQVHGAKVLTARRAGLAGRADILITDRAGLPVAIFTADCLPIVVYDQRNRRLAVAHAGWRGTVEAAARVAVDALVKAGGQPDRFLAAVGPSIGPCCYEVDAPVIDPLAAAFPDAWRHWVTAAGPGKWMLDLWKANEGHLKEAGLSEAQIDNPRLCTACRTDLFFSYRRGQGQGRLVAVAAIPGGSDPAC